MKRLLALASAALVLGSAQAHAQQPLAFVACPMMRDTATVPCWLVEYKGDLYSIDTPESFATAPSLGHQVLVEGAPTVDRRCGGKVLADLHVSVRPDRDATCDQILPATDGFQITGPPPGAAYFRPERPPPRDGSLSQRFDILYDFDWDLSPRDADVIREAAAYAKANPQGEVHVTGYRAAVKLSDGTTLTEEEGLSLRRAWEIVDALLRLGVEDKSIYVADRADPEPGDYKVRHAAIDVVMSGSDEHSEH